jgi:hypothetical protein
MVIRRKRGKRKTMAKPTVIQKRVLLRRFAFSAAVTVLSVAAVEPARLRLFGAGSGEVAGVSEREAAPDAEAEVSLYMVERVSSMREEERRPRGRRRRGSRRKANAPQPHRPSSESRLDRPDERERHGRSCSPRRRRPANA